MTSIKIVDLHIVKSEELSQISGTGLERHVEKSRIYPGLVPNVLRSSQLYPSPPPKPKDAIKGADLKAPYTLMNLIRYPPLARHLSMVYINVFIMCVACMQ